MIVETVNVDVAVIGGGIAGVFAATGAARGGQRVLLAERQSTLGGNATSGGVSGFCGDTAHVNAFWEELMGKMTALDGLAPLNPDADARAFDPVVAEFVFQEAVLAEGVDLLLHTRLCEVRTANGKIKSVMLAGKSGPLEVFASVFIDCTGDADLIRLAGLPVLKGGPVYRPGSPPTLAAEATPMQLPMSLHINMTDTGRAVTPHLPANCPRYENDAEIPMTTVYRLGTNHIRVKIKIIHGDSTDTRSFSDVEIRSRREAMAMAWYLQTRGYGGTTYDTYRLTSIQPVVGIREGARAVGETVLTDDDVRRGAHCDDAVAVGSYHVDYHWPDVAPRAGTGLTAMVPPYQIPWRCLCVQGMANLLTAGRSISTEHRAISSARVMTTCAQTGFAAGAGAALAAGNTRSVRNVDLPTLQRMLCDAGQSLELADYGGYLRNERKKTMFVFEQDRFFASCHASTLVELPSGDVVAAWFAGTKESADDVDIWSAILHDGEWTEPRKVAELEGAPLWNPVLCLHDDTLFLFYRFGRKIIHWESMLTTSADGGRTWSEPAPLPSGFLGPIKNKPIRMSGGLWLCGSSVETETEWFCRMELFDGGTREWIHAVDIKVPDCLRGIIQPAVWESAPGQVHALMRSTLGHVIRADSADGGRTWSTPVATDIPNNNSGIDIAKLRDSSLVLCLNPVAKDWGARTPLALWRSFDNGQTWPETFVLEDEPGEYSYPAVIATSVGVATVYTHKRKQIRYRVIPIEAFTKKP
ncbi:MAG: FAD-dependent oxidoreductase [Lentisphaeria bacterium]|nr:FAD-dependent oxidoreductase [Lentisphaeria bacterium]